MPYGGRQTADADLLDGLDSTDFVRTADIVTAVGDPGADDKVPSEQAVREAVGGGAGSAYSANLLDNAEFAIDQRGGGAARALAPTAYGMDRWYLLHPAATRTVERIDSGVHTSTYAGRLTIDGGAIYGGLAQIVEAVKSRPCRGRTLQLQARVRFDSAATLYYAVLEWTGTADSVTRNIVNNWASGDKSAGNFFLGANLVVAATGTLAVEADTWTALTDTAEISTACNNLIVFIWAETSGVLDLTETDLFAGSSTRTWAPKEPMADRGECYRHCYVVGSIRSSGFRQGTNVVAGFHQAYPVPMRITPSLSHNITGWSNTWSPSGTTVGMYNSITAAAVQITGALTINTQVIDRYLFIHSYTAGTSFDGSAGNIGILGFGSDVKIVISADL
jgi:hypothetical protein